MNVKDINLYFNVSITSRELQACRLGLVSAGEVNVSVSSRSRKVSVSVSSRSRAFASSAHAFMVLQSFDLIRANLLNDRSPEQLDTIKAMYSRSAIARIVIYPIMEVWTVEVW